MDDLIAIPTLGPLYQVTLLCGHVAFGPGKKRTWWCRVCDADKWPGTYKVVRPWMT